MATVTDNFNRAAGALGTAPTGQTWANFNGATVAINATQQAEVTGATADAGAVIDCASADAVYQATFVNAALASGGLIFRYVDTLNFWIAQNVGATTLSTRKFVAGVYTDLNDAYAWANGDIVTVECSGNNIVVKINGVIKRSVTDAALNTGTKGGLLARPSGIYDDFSITVGGGGGSPPTIPAGSGKYVYGYRRRVKRYRYNASYVY